MKPAGYPTIGIALGSGGAKGLSHLGVLKAFEAHGITIDYIAGSSIGALMGAYYAAYPSYDKLNELLSQFNAKKVFSLFDPTIRGGLLKGNKIETFIAEILDGKTFSSLEIPFSAVATDMYSAEEIVISDGDLTKALRASMSVPAIFQPVEYEKHLLADGGLSDPVPTEVVRNMGSDIVVAVNLHGNYFPESEAPSLSKTPMHSINILSHNLILQSLKTADILISPNVPKAGLVGWNYFFNLEKAQHMVQAGEHAAEEIIPELEYLIEQKKKEQKSVKRFFSFFKVLRS